MTQIQIRVTHIYIYRYKLHTNTNTTYTRIQTQLTYKYVNTNYTHIEAQIIDDFNQTTLVAASSKEKSEVQNASSRNTKAKGRQPLSFSRSRAGPNILNEVPRGKPNLELT